MTSRKAHLDGRAVVCMVGLCFLWGLNQVAAKALLSEVPAMQQATLRSIGSALLVCAWARWRRIRLFETDGTLFGGLVAGLLFAAEFGCIFFGLQFTTASRMVVFLYLSPFVVALGMPFISPAERLSSSQIAGLLAAFSGVAWAYAEGFSKPSAGGLQWLGDALGACAAVFWGATTLCIRATRLGSASAEKTLLYQLAVSGCALAFAAIGEGLPLPTRLSALAWGSLVFQVVIVTFMSFLVWFWLMRNYPATRLASFTLLTPVFGLMLGAVLLGEHITSRLAIALAAVASGIILVNRKAG